MGARNLVDLFHFPTLLMRCTFITISEKFLWWVMYIRGLQLDRHEI